MQDNLRYIAAPGRETATPMRAQEQQYHYTDYHRSACWNSPIPSGN